MMGPIAYSADHRHQPVRLKASILGITQRTLGDFVTLLSAIIDSLAARITVCECVQGATEEVSALNAAIAALRSDVDQLKPRDMSIIFGMVEIPDMSNRCFRLRSEMRLELRRQLIPSLRHRWRKRCLGLLRRFRMRVLHRLRRS